MTEIIGVLAADRLFPELLRQRLGPLGYQLDVARDAGELQTSCLPRLPRALLVPARFPGTDLTELVAAVKLAALRCAVIVFGIDEDDRARARQVNADAFLRVPFSDTEILDVLGVSTRARKLVLLADDSPLIHRHTAPILEEAGYDVVSAMDGEEALAQVALRRPDLVITDVEMPRLDGFQVCKRLKEAAETAHLPVLICSALGEAHDLERGFDAGADDYLVKPVLPEELSTRIRQLLVGTMPALRERILVVDDSPAQRHYVQDCLSRQGFEVMTAENGRVGLARSRAHMPNLIVSDYDMPEMNGFEMVLALKRERATRDIPVIMLTARDSRRDVAQMRAAGATAYLVKPFGQDKCIAIVERTLAERRLFAYTEASRPYLSDGAARVAEARARSGDLAPARAEERETSILFSDICGFTHLSSRLTPREVIDLLNQYFDMLCPIVKDEGGELDKFIGDAIMAVFEDMPGREPAPIRAVRSGLAMQDALHAWNVGQPIRLEMRIGVNTGTVVRGDIGPQFRREYASVGDTVNRANRYEMCCPPGKVLVSQSTREALGLRASCEPLPGLLLKGVDGAVVGYVVKELRE